MAEGVCKLTGQWGKFVDSHLLPKSLTKPIVAGAPLIQAGRGNRPTRRWSSWSDKRLVIREGEEVLSKLDDWAIKELRARKLLWSGWGPMLSLAGLHRVYGPEGQGARQVEIDDPERLRLFFHSLLWRAASTDRAEFSEVSLPPSDLARLRRVVLGEIRPDADFYPIQLTQLSTVGLGHNLSPIAVTKTIPAVGEMPERRIPIFRFYFDGLIAHFHNHANDDGYSAALGKLMVGAEKNLMITTVPYEVSFQLENLRTLMDETYRNWSRY